MADLLGKPVRPKSQAELEAEAREAADALAKAKIQALVNPAAPTNNAPVAELNAPTLRQPASPKAPSAPKQRLAGEKMIELFVDGADENLRAWKDTPRPEKGANYLGRNLGEWRDHNNALANEINDLADQGRWGTVGKRLFDEGYRHDELEAQIKELKDGYRGRLRQDRYDVSQAAADEELSRQLLEVMGAKDAVINNRNPLMGTDLRAVLNGREVNIDSQQRAGLQGELNLGVFQRAPGLIELVYNHPDTALIDLIDRYRMGGYYKGFEDKLLQDTGAWNKDPSWIMRQNPEAFKKDVLVTNARPGRYTEYLHDKELPKSTGLIDLAKARELILPMSLNELEANRMSVLEKPAFEKGSLKLNIPRQQLVHMLIPNENIQQINEFLAQQYENRSRRGR